MNKYKLIEIGFNNDYSLETPESLIKVAKEHCMQYDDGRCEVYCPIDTVEKAIKYFTECSFIVERLEYN